MPQGDRTGPMGQGPRTGKSLGLCSGYDTPGFTKGFGGQGRGFGFGQNMGRGRGFGRGYRFRNFGPGNVLNFPYSSVISKKEEIDQLKSQADYFKRSQQAIEKRLEELEGKSE
ncbi:MAG: DUF5320 domain-containing protein [Bacteroidales bacterium]|nr:DUF5320 domain-containing protein [Bacteroidales bacterium]